MRTQEDQDEKYLETRRNRFLFLSLKSLSKLLWKWKKCVRELKKHPTFQKWRAYLSVESPLGRSRPSYTLCFGCWTAVGISWPEESEMWPEASGEIRETLRASCSNRQAHYSFTTHALTNVIYESTYMHRHTLPQIQTGRLYIYTHTV